MFYDKYFPTLPNQSTSHALFSAPEKVLKQIS